MGDIECVATIQNHYFFSEKASQLCTTVDWFAEIADTPLLPCCAPPKRESVSRVGTNQPSRDDAYIC